MHEVSITIHPNVPLLVDDHVTRPAVDTEQALEGQLAVFKLTEWHEVCTKVINVSNVEFGMLYEFMRMSWTAGIRSKKAVRVIEVFREIREDHELPI
jgi:hypothetical protein